MATRAADLRIQALNDALSTRGVLRLREAAELLQVAEMTVRRLVTAHPQRFAYLGGHILRKTDIGAGGGYSLLEEETSHSAAKARACKLAANLILPGDTVFIDCGTTLDHLARLIGDDLPVTVVCYSLNVARRIAGKRAARLFVLGGMFHPTSASFASADSPAALAGFGITKAFLSAGGVDARLGVSCSNPHEVPVKQQALRCAKEKYLVVDASKFDRLRPAVFASVADFDAIISERGVRRKRPTNRRR